MQDEATSKAHLTVPNWLERMPELCKALRALVAKAGPMARVLGERAASCAPPIKGLRTMLRPDGVPYARAEWASRMLSDRAALFASLPDQLGAILRHEGMRNACAELMTAKLSGNAPSGLPPAQLVACEILRANHGLRDMTRAQLVAWELLALPIMRIAPGATAAQARAEAKRYPNEAAVILAMPVFARAGRRDETQNPAPRYAARCLAYRHRTVYGHNLYGVTATEVAAVFDLTDGVDPDTVRDWVKA